MLTGSSPIAMPGIPHPASWKCLSFASMTKGVNGVEFACPEGLASFPPGGGSISTKSLFTEVEWQALKPETFIAAHHAGRYYFAFQTAAETAMMILQRSEPAALLKANIKPTALYACEDDANLYMAIGNKVYQWDADQGTKMVFDWMSREVMYPDPTTFGAFMVDAEFNMTQAQINAALAANQAIVAANQATITALLAMGEIDGDAFNASAINGDLLQTPPTVTWDSVLFQFYVNGKLRYSKEIIDTEGHRLKKYSSADQVAIRLSGNARVKGAFIAGSLKELKEV
jgi:hypothetical protein